MTGLTRRTAIGALVCSPAAVRTSCPAMIGADPWASILGSDGVWTRKTPEEIHADIDRAIHRLTRQSELRLTECMTHRSRRFLPLL